jgi:hypothetical protein
MQAFDLIEMAALAGVNPAKAKNWTNNRPFTIGASIRSGAGRGSVNLYSIEDVYLMALAGEFSKAGFAAMAIGKLVEAVQAKFDSLAGVSSLTVWRPKAGGPFRLSEGRDKPPDATLWVTVSVRELVQGVDRKVG